MVIFSKLMSVIRGNGRAESAATPGKAVEPAYGIPTVKFDLRRVTEAVKTDLANNIKEMKEFDEFNFFTIYDLALRSIFRGGDTATLFNSIMELNLPGMTRRRASEISLSLNNKASALMERNRQVSAGIKYAIWVYSGAPCHVNPKNPSANDIRRDATHRAANGKRYDIAKGMLLNGRLTAPGQDEGCKCISRSIIPGLDQ